MTTIVVEPATPHPVYTNVMILNAPIKITVYARVLLIGAGEWANVVHIIEKGEDFFLVEVYDENGEKVRFNESNKLETLEEALELAQDIYDRYAANVVSGCPNGFAKLVYHVLADSAPARPPSVGWW